jgi:hypothetical protein
MSSPCAKKIKMDEETIKCSFTPIRVGRRIYNGKKYTDPQYDDYIPIICMTASTAYGSLSPYVLKNDHGHIMENIWQFSKVYEKVPYTKQKYSSYDPTVIWEHPSEEHYTNGTITDAYLQWRKKGFENKYPVRYPVPFDYRHNCIGSIMDVDKPVLLDYIEARKAIYLPMYCDLVKKDKKKFIKLKKMLKEGKKLLIIEVDGPHQESLDYYTKKYNTSDTFIERNTVEATKENLQILLNDRKHPFGHGYCLAVALLDLTLQ